MSIEDRVLIRLNALIEEGVQLSIGNEYGQVFDNAHATKCEGWVAAARHVTGLVFPDPNATYRLSVERLAKVNYGGIVNGAVATIREVLLRIISDARDGLLSSVADTARAEVFDDFLDHAKHYQKNGKKNEAGTIAGVIFEDSIRRLCNKHSIASKDQELDQLITALSKIDVLTGTKAKRARSAAHVRTKATHAQWDEFDAGDVDATLAFIGEVIPMLEA